MTATIQLFLPQQYSATIPVPSEGSTLKVGAFPQNQTCDLSAAEITGLCEQTAADFVGFLDFPISDSGLPDPLVSGQLETPQNSLIVCPFNGATLFSQAWDTLTPTAASLALNPLENALILFRKADLQNLQNLTANSHLLWQAFIQLIQAEADCQILDAVIDVDDYHGFPRHLPELAPHEPGPECEWLYSLLQAYQPEKDLPHISSRPDAKAVKAGLLCIHDYLEESHQYSQSVQHDGRHRAGDYWHHIMHRREPDYSNAKYWSRAVGHHPLLNELPDVIAPLFAQFEDNQVLDWQTPLVSSGKWSLNEFVDCCAESAASGNPSLNTFARQSQWIEMQLLLQRTSLDATTG